MSASALCAPTDNASPATTHTSNLRSSLVLVFLQVAKTEVKAASRAREGDAGTRLWLSPRRPRPSHLARRGLQAALARGQQRRPEW